MNQDSSLKSKTITGSSPEEHDQKVNEWLAKNPLDVRSMRFVSYPVQNVKGKTDNLKFTTEFATNITFCGEEAVEEAKTED